MDFDPASLCRGITWMTKDGLRQPNYFGSLTQAATVRLGNYKGEEVFTPFKKLLPMVSPNDLVLGGWDISGLNLAESMERAQVGSSLYPSTQAGKQFLGTRCAQHATKAYQQPWSSCLALHHAGVRECSTPIAS